MTRPYPAYNKHLEARAAEILQEAEEHAGEFAARTLDGRTTLEFAASREELLQKLLQRGIARSEVVIAYLPDESDGEIF